MRDLVGHDRRPVRFLVYLWLEVEQRGESIAALENFAGSEEGKEAMLREYVSTEHRDDPGNGCIMAALATDFKTQPKTRTVVTHHIRSLIERFGKQFPWSSKRSKRKQSINVLATMAGAVKSTGVHTSIGLQLRGSAAVLSAQQAIKDGRIGRPLTARIVSSTGAFGPVVEAAMAFGEDADNGVTLVTIQGAHTFDLAVAVLGGFASLAALTSTQYPDVTVGDEPGLKPRSTSDHVFLQGMLQSGVAIGIEVSGGRPPQAPTHFEVIGTDGTLTLRGGAMRGVQSGRLHLFLDDEKQELNERKLAGMPDAAVNVTGVYTMLRDDILAGTHSAPGFDHAVQLNRMVDAISASSQQGIRQIEKGWPTA